MWGFSSRITIRASGPDKLPTTNSDASFKRAQASLVGDFRSDVQQTWAATNRPGHIGSCHKSVVACRLSEKTSYPLRATCQRPRLRALGESLTAYDTGMDLQFTAVFRRVPEGYIGFVEELPGANTQGATLDEARANLQEAVTLVLEANRTLAQEGISGQDVIRETLKVGA